MRYTLELIAVVTIGFFILLLTMQYAGGDTQEEEAWGGADSEAAAIIEASGYTPWFEPVWEPPSGEIETLLFTLQAAAGATVIGYFFGYYRGRGRAGE